MSSFQLMTMMMVFIMSGEGRSYEIIKFPGAVVFKDRDNSYNSWGELQFNRGPPPAPQVQYSRDEIRCFQGRKVLHKGKCWDLLRRGPCGEGEWLVLDSEVQGIRPVCQERVCASDEAYWLPTKECIHLTDKKTCTKKETSLQVNALGYGACKCMSGLARGMAQNGNCYKLYTRGLCDAGYVVVLSEEEGEYGVTCVPDICQPYYRNNTSNDLLLPYKGKCYADGSHEPCTDELVLSVDVHTGQPTCSKDLNALNIIAVPPACSFVDHKGNCPDSQTTKYVSNIYVNDLKSDQAKMRGSFGKG